MLSKFSVKKPYTIVVSVVLIIILGCVAFSNMTADLLPSIDFPYAIVMTPYVGATPEEVELVVTKPVEEAMATVNNIKKVTSISKENVSVVILEFNDGVDMNAASIEMRENLDTVSSYWKDSVGNSTIMKLNPDMLPVMVAAVDVDDSTTGQVSEYVVKKIIPQLESIEGVASVSESGVIEQQANVIINEKKLKAVNNKVQDAVNKKMEAAENKLNDAKDKLEDSKEELNSKSEEYYSALLTGEQGISSAKEKILKGELKIEQANAELEQKEEELKAAETEITSKEKQLKEAEEKINSQETKEKESQLKEAIATVETTEETLDAKVEELMVTKTGIQTLIATAESNDELDGEEKEAAIEKLNAKLEETNTALSELKEKQKTLEDKKKELQEGLDQITEAKQQITAGKKELAEAKTKLQEGKKAIATGKSQLQEAEKELAQGKGTVSEKENELNTKKAEGSEQLNEASSKLSKGENELDEKSEELEKQKAEALEQADVSKTLTKDTLTKLLEAQNFSMPAGYITEDGVDYLVRVGGELTSVEELENLTLVDYGIDGIEPITLSDVADVFLTDNSEEVYAKVNGNDAVILSIQKQNNYATAQVSQKIKDKLDEISSENSKVHATYLSDQGMYINLVVDSVLDNLILGGILAIIILLLFLRDIKPTFIIACSIPISVMFAIVLMYFSGVTLNVISLSGLAVGVGMLVDNSVVVIENIYRLRSKGTSVIKAAVSGAVQVAGAIASSTLTTICVFLPIVFVKGITKQLFTDMALTIGYSLGASLIVALTLVPMMSAGLLKKVDNKEHRLFNYILSGYQRTLEFALKMKKSVLLIVSAILVFSVVLCLKQGTSYMPEMDSTQVSVSVVMPTTMTADEIKSLSNNIIKKIQTIKEVEKVGATFSISNMTGLVTSVNNIDMYVILKEDKEHTSQEIARQIEDMCKDLSCTVTASGSSMDMSSIGGSGITIEVKGNDLDKLQEIAKDVAKIVKQVKGTEQVNNGIENPTDELRINIDKDKAMQNGLTVAQAYKEVQEVLSSSNSATSFSENSVEYSVNVKQSDSNKMTLDDIRDYQFSVEQQDGTTKQVKVSEIASIEEAQGLGIIRRSGQQREIKVSSEIADGYNVGLVTKQVQEKLKDYKVPTGYEVSFNGENETIQDSLYELIKMLLLGIVFIYLIMVAQFQSLLSPFIVLFTIPLAFTGGFLGLTVTGKELSVISMIGFVLLAGIIVNNGIVLVDYINQLRADGVEKRKAILQAGKTRMRPILMTALTTILGLSSMAFGMGMGADMVQPIAIVTISGLTYATFMTLYVIPCLYDLLHRKEMVTISEEELEVADD